LSLKKKSPGVNCVRREKRPQFGNFLRLRGTSLSLKKSGIKYGWGPQKLLITKSLRKQGGPQRGGKDEDILVIASQKPTKRITAKEEKK